MPISCKDYFPASQSHDLTLPFYKIQSYCVTYRSDLVNDSLHHSPAMGRVTHDKITGRCCWHLDKRYIESIGREGFNPMNRSLPGPNDGVFRLRKEMKTCIVNSDSKKDDIGSQNACLGDINL